MLEANRECPEPDSALAHVRHVLTQLSTLTERDAVERGPPFDSWVRCSTKHGLTPDGRCRIPRVTDRELAIEREQLGEKLALAKNELDYLDLIVRSSGYSVTLSNAHCMIVAGRNQPSPSSAACDERPGTVWSECFGGTNAIGTSLHDLIPTSLRKHEHFFAEHVNESCLNIPLIAPDCTVWASLGISNKNLDLDAATHVLALKVLSASAERLSQEVFRHAFKDSWIFKFKAAERAQAGLLAITDDGYVVGADRVARQALGIPFAKLVAFSLWEKFSEDRANLVRLFTGADGECELISTDGRTTVRGTAIDPFQRQRQSSAIAPSRPSRAITSEHGITMDEWCGADPTMMQDVVTLRRLITKRLPIILLGETGVGKDTLARAYTAESPRRHKPFVAINCAAIPESLIESELFGYDSGAFTGARKGGSPGRFKQADGGTLFLDEIGEMPLLLQTRLLRVLESGEIYPLGSVEPQVVDVQVIAATNSDLEAGVAAGTFRADLYYRLAGIVVRIPALRDRRDVERVVDIMAARIAEANGLEFSPAACDMLHAHRWPGNLRELALVLERAASLASPPLIEPRDLRINLPAAEVPRIGASWQKHDSERARRPEAHYEAMISAIESSNGDVNTAAKILGISRATFYRRLNKSGISRAIMQIS